MLCEYQRIARDALGIRWCEGTDSNTVFLAEGQAFDGYIFDMPGELSVHHVAAMRAQVALDVQTKLFLDIRAQIVRYEVKRFLMHGTIPDGVEGARINAAVCFQS